MKYVRHKVLSGLVLSLALLGATRAFAQGLSFAGPGSKARSLGGAFTALADDYSAIYWNPAGLAWTGRGTYGLSLDAAFPRGTMRLRTGSWPGGSAPDIQSRTSNGELSTGSAGAVFPVGRRFFLGLGVYSPVNTGTVWSGADLAPLTANRSDIRWSGRLSVLTLAPVVAYKIDEQFSIGASLTANYGRFAFSRYAGNFSAPLPEPPYFREIDLGQYEESSTGWGFGATLGFSFRPSDRFSLGAVLRTATSISFNGEASVEGFPALATALSRSIGRTSAIRKTIEWPVGLSLGLAGRPLEILTLAVDFEWTRWSSLDAIDTVYQDPAWTSYMGERGNDHMPMFIRDTLRVRLGAEARLGAWAVRAGFFTDPSPAADDSINPFFPSRGALAATLGAGFLFSSWKVDGFIEYRAPRALSVGPTSMPVGPLSSRTIWDFQLPGQYEGKALTVGFAVSRVF